MMLRFTILCLMVLSFVSCKQKGGASQNTMEVAVKDKPADLGGLYQYYHANPTTLDQREENTIIEYLANKNLEAVRTQSGVYIHTIEEGVGDQVKWGDPLTVDYKGYFLNGNEFDSSYGRGEPISFRVGSMNAGWNEALPFLKKGGKATLVIPSHMGYGPKGFPGYVDPNTIILFDVDVKNETNK